MAQTKKKCTKCGGTGKEPGKVPGTKVVCSLCKGKKEILSPIS